MFFDGWDSVARVVVLAALIYAILVVALRVVGEQALAKMSAYELLVTVALGAFLAHLPFIEGVTLADAAAGIATVLLLQEATRWLVRHSRTAKHLVIQRPQLVLWEGRLLRNRVQELKLREEEVLAAVRAAGLGSLNEVQAVVLETDGEWSVIARSDAGDLSAFKDLDLPGR